MLNYIDELIQKYEECSENVVNLTALLNKQKIEVECKKLELKYGESFKNIKTVKEKEERALIAVKKERLELIELESDLNKAKIERNKAKYEIEAELTLMKGDENE